MKTQASNRKVRELISLVKEGKLVPRPEFQRRLVWSRDDKNHFLDSVLRGYPFPEIYLADGQVDLETGSGTQLLVDGLQRVSTLIQYFEDDPQLRLTTVPPYRMLGETEKREFLQYDVAVRDLGSLSREEIIDVFRRLNATKYSLTDIEVNNALYSGALKKFCERVASDEFFVRHGTFTPSDFKRMGDLKYVLTIVGTLMVGYFNRDDAFEGLLDRYNDDFPAENEMSERLERTLAFIEECNFLPSLRIWKKADLFTLIVEMDQALHVKRVAPQPNKIVEAITRFLSAINANSLEEGPVAAVYYKAALQATNDRINRVRRGIIMAGLVIGESYSMIEKRLVDEGFIDTYELKKFDLDDPSFAA